MSIRRILPEDEVDTLIAEVQADDLLTAPITNPNHNNGYLIEKAWAKVALKLNCTVSAVKSKWMELCTQRFMEMRNTPKLTSGSAGIPKNYKGLSTNAQISFVKDKNKPKAKTSGNLDTIQASHTASSSQNTSTSKESNVLSVLKDAVTMTDEQFFSSLCPALKELNDEDKLNFRIDFTDFFEVIRKRSKSKSVNNEDEIVCLGSWTPDSYNLNEVKSNIKGEPDK